MDALERFDADSRVARAARLVWLSELQVQFGAIADRAETLARIAPWDAARAPFEREGWALGQFAHDISDATLDAAAVLDVAEHAAIEACGGERVPQEACLILRPPSAG